MYPPDTLVATWPNIAEPNEKDHKIHLTAGPLPTNNDATMHMVYVNHLSYISRGLITIKGVKYECLILCYLNGISPRVNGCRFLYTYQNGVEPEYVTNFLNMVRSIRTVGGLQINGPTPQDNLCPQAFQTANETPQPNLFMHLILPCLVGAAAAVS